MLRAHIGAVRRDAQSMEAAMTKGKVLVIGSNATRIEVRGGWGSTGQYLNETVVPAMAIIEAGYDVVLATPNGTKPHASTSALAVMNTPSRQAAFMASPD